MSTWTSFRSIQCLLLVYLILFLLSRFNIKDLYVCLSLRWQVNKCISTDQSKKGKFLEFNNPRGARREDWRKFFKILILVFVWNCTFFHSSAMHVYHYFWPTQIIIMTSHLFVYIWSDFLREIDPIVRWTRARQED